MKAFQFGFILLIIGGIICGYLEAVENLQEVSAVLQLARSKLGTEESLRRVQTLRYSGVFENYVEKTQGTFIIYLKSKYKQRTEFQADGILRTTATDGFEGWTRVTKLPQVDAGTKPEAAQKLEEKVVPLSASELKRLQYNAYDNLNFFSDLADIRGKVVLLGRVVQDGFLCYQVKFQFDDEIAVDRFFDTEDGSLVATKTLNNVFIRETGEQMISGIRFPRRVDAYRDGFLLNRMTYTEIAVNEDIPDFIFSFPTEFQRASKTEE